MTKAQHNIIRASIFVSIAIMLIGMTLKIMHFPYAVQIMVGAFVAIAALYLVRFLGKKTKKFLDIVKLVLVTFWTLHGVLIILHLPYRFPVQIAAWIAVITWFFLEGVSYVDKNKDDEAKESSKSLPISKIINVIGGVAIGVTFMGVLFKLQHWPFATIFIVGGLALGSIWVIKEMFFGD
jgi:hypothetical protein